MAISDLRWDFISVCFKEAGDAQRNVHMAGLLICSLLGSKSLETCIWAGDGPCVGKSEPEGTPLFTG